MKGIHIVTSIEKEASGPTYSVVRLCESLVANGQNIILMTLGNKKTKLRFHRIYARVKWLPRLGISPTMKSDIERIVREGSVEYIHSHGLWQMPNIYAGQVAKKYNIPLIVSPRGALSEKAMKTGYKLIKSLFWIFFQKKILISASCFHATSNDEYKDIRRIGFKQPVSIIPNGVDFQENEKKIDQPFKTLLFFGRLHPIKGVENLLYAWSEIYNFFPDWRLKIAGPGERQYVKKIKLISSTLSLQRVEFSGPLYGEDKWNAYRNADLYILPSFSENFGMTVAESLSVGTPVITTKGTPWSDLVDKKSGFWVDGNIESLVSCLHEALPDILQLRVMGENGKRWMIQDFSWDLVEKNMSIFYTWIIHRDIKNPENIRLN
jgi:glycosyltransferase involved in cell wall biosynthesis